MEFREAASTAEVHVADLAAEHALVSQPLVGAVPAAS